jgi:hypothetical protein
VADLTIDLADMFSAAAWPHYVIGDPPNKGYIHRTTGDPRLVQTRTHFTIATRAAEITDEGVVEVVRQLWPCDNLARDLQARAPKGENLLRLLRRQLGKVE